MIELSGHGKSIVDGINTCDKKFLLGNMCMLLAPEIDDRIKIIATRSMIEN